MPYCVMKIVSFIFVPLMLISCLQNKQKENSKHDSPSDSLTIEAVEIIDSTCGNYSVDTDTAYFYARPDSNTISGAYLTKDEWTMICNKTGEFGYAVELTDSSLVPKGWVKLKYFKKIFFNPPEVRKE